MASSPGLAPCPGVRRQLLTSLEELAGLDLGGKRLLLAIGARRLRQALLCSPDARHFARILPHPTSLALARAAGLADAQLACLHPRPAPIPNGSGSGSPGAWVDQGSPGRLGPGAIERALCRRWAIDTVLCRQSGGITEQLWSDLCSDLGLELLLLRQPRASDPAPGLELAALLAALGDPGSGSQA